MPFGNILGFWHLVKEVDPSDIAEAAERLPKIEIDADPALTTDLTEALGAGASRSAFVFQRVTDGVVGTANLVIEDTGDRIVRRLAPRLVVRIDPAAVDGRVEQADPDRTIVTVPSRSTAALREALVPVNVDRLPDHAIALGRHFPPFQSCAAQSIVRATSRANAEFAAISNLPQLVPIVGNVIGTAADFLVLTKNQVLMLIKLATIYDRDSRHGLGILREIAPVVGAGFLWRTIAREIAGLVPFYAGAIPKIVIAYAGTFAVGMAAIYYYEEGRKPPREVWRSFQLQALERVRDVRALLPRGRGNGSSADGR
ncbi:MAG TPA: hypothetical protein VHL09_17235 [Dehalococcoidia bacterium]|nr:hypothetical protein [Dehalococcoidia bacterium]